VSNGANASESHAPANRERRPAKLALEDGRVFTGWAFGADGEVDGEVCFNTSMTGYQEILTDPSYRGQIVAMTYPQIGNYGINPGDMESRRVFLSGFIVRELCPFPSNFRSTQSLDAYLRDQGTIGLEGIDTRTLVKHLRVRGAMNGVLSTTDLDDASLVAKAKASPGLVGRDLVQEVIPSAPYEWNEPLPALSQLNPRDPDHLAKEPHVVALDFGMKWNIPRHLRQLGCRVTVLPGKSTAKDVLSHNPDGVFLSNGPGDPRPLDYAINTIRDLLGQKPIFGICLGQQLLGLATGCEIFKLKFGHRGANQPVMNHDTGKVEITTQNHGFAVSADSLPKNVEVTHLNLNDRTVEGIRLKDVPAFAVQYHPEASAGPHDSQYLFEQFVRMLA
jgi:carbamoyl-phosphate synthase small subunit